MPQPHEFKATWRALGRKGVFAPFLDDRRLREGCKSLEELAYHHEHLGIFISIVSGCGLALPLLKAHADAKRQQRVVRGDEVVAVAITERGAGSDVLSMSSQVRRRDGKLLLNGEKWCITNAPVADAFIVFAQYVSDDETFLCAVVVDADQPGVCLGKALDLAGAKGSPTGSVTFEDVAIDFRQIIGSPTDGRRLLELAFLRERLLAPWPLIGRMSRALQEAMDRVCTRTQFGRPIKDYQYIQEKIVSAFERLETSRLLAGAALDRFESDELVTAHASLAKYHSAESAAQTFKALVEVYGATGVLQETGLTASLVDALCASIAGGTRESHKKLVFQQLQLDRGRARRSNKSHLFTHTHTAEERGGRRET